MSDIDFEGHKGKNAAAGTNPTDLVIVSQLIATAGGAPIEVDGIATGAVQLSSLALPASGFVFARVKTVKDLFYLDRTSTLTADGITIVTALGGTGRWIRARIGDVFWRTQLTWTIDPIAGNDENLGDSGHPLKTRSELYRRLGPDPLYTNTITINILSSLLTTDVERPGFLSDTSSVSGTAAYIKFVGTPRVLFTGALGNVAGDIVNRNGSTGTHTSISIPTLPSTWTVGDGVTSFLDPGVVISWTDGVGNFIEARPVVDLGGARKTAWVTVPITRGNIESTFTLGTTVTIFDVPSLGHDEYCPPGHVEYTNLKVSGGRFFSTTGTVFQTNCSGDIICAGGSFSSSNGRTGIVLGQSFQALASAANVQGGYHRLIWVNGSGGRLNVCPTIIGIQIETGASMVGLVNTGGPQATCDLEFNTSVSLQGVRFDLSRGHLDIAGFVYGAINGPAFAAFLTQGSIINFAHAPNCTGTNATVVAFNLAGTTASTATLTTSELNDRFGNRFIGPAGPTVNDNASQPIANLGSGGTTGTNAANINDVLSLGGVSTPITNKATLITLNVVDGSIRYVQTYRDYFRLDKVTTRTAVSDEVIQSTVNAAWWWVRLNIADPFWGTVTDWWIDPAGTNTPAGNDEAVGDATHPIKTIAEWRRRVNGTSYSGNGVNIHALSSSTNEDDAMFYGFSTPDLATYVRVVGVPRTIGVSGTIGTYQAYSGNTRGSFIDPGIPTSWTASNAISNSTGSKWIRKTGTGVRHYAPLLKDLGSKTVQFGMVVDWDETDTVTVQQTETNFTNGDAYEVVSLPTWPSPKALSGNVQLQCFDILGLVPPQDASLTNHAQIRFRLCGFHQNTSFVQDSGAILYSSVICATTTNAGFSSSVSCNLINCAAVGTILQFNFTGYSWNGATNVIVNSEFRIWHSSTFGSLGSLRMFDCATPLISVNHNSSCVANGAIVGSGNTGYLVQCTLRSVLAGSVNITATTTGSGGNIYNVNGVGYNSPTFDASSGDAIY